MLQLQTSTDEMNLAEGSGTSWKPLIAAENPPVHRVVVHVRLTALAVGSRSLTVRIASTDYDRIYAEINNVIESAAAGNEFTITSDPLPVSVALGLKVDLKSDNENDTAVTVETKIYSVDVEYYLAYRAAETSPTADSLVERAKSVDDRTVLIVENTNELQSDWKDGGRLDLLIDGIKTETDKIPTSDAVADAVWAEDTRTLTAATNLNIPTSDNNAAAVWAEDTRTLTADTNINYPSSDAVADAILKTDVSDVQDTAGKHSLTTVVLGATESSITGNTWTIKKTTGDTFTTKTVTSDANAQPITGVT